MTYYDPSKLETIPANEPAIIDTIVHGILTDQEAKFKPGTTARRDVHSKSHGTVDNALFMVRHNLPKAARLGLFALRTSLNCTIRFSNGAPGVGPDALPNVRGIALKVHGVPGDKLLTGDEKSADCDFLMANHPTSFHRRLVDYPAIQDIMKDGKIGLLFKRFPNAAFLLMRAVLKLVKNPLTTTYYSQTPYMLGDRAVKYALVPRQKSSFWSLPNFRDRDYLRHAVEKMLYARSARFVLCVQFQQPGDSVEDPGIRWNGPLVPVADITLPQRRLICHPATDTLPESGGEALTFNPWRTLPEHRPLGWVNRVRQIVYAADYKWRTDKNAAMNDSVAAGKGGDGK